MVLICIYLIINVVVEHLLICLLATCISAHFLIGQLVFLILSYRSSFCILEINPWSVASFANIFFPFCRLSFHFGYGFFCYVKPSKFNWVTLLYFVFILITLGSGSKEM